MSATLMPDEELSQLATLREGVSGLLSSPQVERLLGLWQECRASKAHCSVPSFVERVSQDLELDEQVAGQLRLKLFGVVLSARKTERATAAVVRPEPRSHAVRQPVVRDAGDEVFLALVDALELAVRARFPAQWKGLCTALLHQVGGRMGPLLRGGASTVELVGDIDEEAARCRFIHHYYLALCEVLGPVQADRLLSDAVRQVEQLPAAAAYAPRRLL